MILALFDFDGTISAKDSFKLFLLKASSSSIDFNLKYYLYCLRDLTAYKLGRISEEKLKLARLKVFLENKEKSEIERLSEQFFESVLPKIIKPSAQKRLDWHQNKNHQIFIVSASFNICLEKWCKKNRYNLLTNIVMYDGNKILPELNRPDCNHHEKVNRIKEAIPSLRNFNKIYAYGDTPGDYPMLELADEKFYQYFT